jgi:hypothetical protein
MFLLLERVDILEGVAATSVLKQEIQIQDVLQENGKKEIY